METFADTITRYAGIFFIIFSLTTTVVVTLLILVAPLAQRLGILHNDNKRLRLGATLAYVAACVLFALGVLCIV